MPGSILDPFRHVIGRLTGRYYFEDYLRVYPDGIFYDGIGRGRHASPDDRRNYLNHLKFYRFVAQFVARRSVVDLGCGSGYGCQVLKEEGGASTVQGCDLSSHALRFARSHFGRFASFTRQSITNLKQYSTNAFDVAVSSEVLEHLKEYRMERRALSEIRRVTRPGGLVVLATPNQEVLPDHGFSFDDLDSLVREQFDQYCIFENALLPFSAVAREGWRSRAASGRLGVVVTEKINLEETVLPAGESPHFKEGIPPGLYSFVSLDINTALLHNTHSWIVLALKRQ